ncbi:MAG: sigma-70 family RNA polymerase sigma factor [Deltaproteobacteria bacterium]|nr:MAG: sigma-70 family RNA polymerase sigma factor [Deltaproteobacteria bacterium]
MDPQQLYTRNAPALLRKCERMLGNRADAEDIVQQLFVDLIRRGRTDVDLPYLYRAATHRCLNRIRDRRRRRELLDRHGEGLLWREPPRIDDRLLSMEMVARLVDRLDERGGEVFALHFVDGIDQGEVAAMIGTSRRTVVKHVARIRRLARELS